MEIPGQYLLYINVSKITWPIADADVYFVIYSPFVPGNQINLHYKSVESVSESEALVGCRYQTHQKSQ